jgi:hypothetical protein
VRALRARPGVAAIICLGLAWGLTMHTTGWAQLAHFAEVRAIAHGRAEIDTWHWETNDKAWVNGHYYSVKSPGVAMLSLPPYLAIKRSGAGELAKDAARNARGTAQPMWAPEEVPSAENYGYDPERATRVETRVELNTPIVWALTLLVSVIPAVLLLLAVRWAADRLEPGYGTAAAVTLGLATIVMTFASEYFSHVIAGALGFGAFAVLMREREGPRRVWLVALAGLLAGLAVTFEYPLGLLGAVLFVYALAGRDAMPARGLAYAGGALLGVVPMLAFNQWALGSPFHLAYSSAVDVQGITGHDILGLNSSGFFGIGMPTPENAIDLLFAGKGMLTLTPIVVAAVIGLVLMRRRGHRAEFNVIAAVSVAYLIYDAGYWLPFGGGTPGPRFLIPILPFLALGLAFAYRRLPALTLGLAVPSALVMVAGAMTLPMLGEQGPGTWVNMLGGGELEHTLLTAFGVTNAWLAIAPVIAALIAAIVLAARATPSLAFDDLRLGVLALLGWAGLATVAPTIAGSDVQPLSGDPAALTLTGAVAAIGLLTLGAIWLTRRTSPAAAPIQLPALPSAGRAPANQPAIDGEPALGSAGQTVGEPIS